MRARTRILSSALAAVAVASAAPAAVTVDFANVNGPGNACDVQPQGCFGGVAVPFRIAVHEVTNAQYADVTYRTDPEHDYPEYDIAHDSAYWVSEIRPRLPGYVDVDLTSRGCGGADPVYGTGQDAGVGPATLSGVPMAWVSTFRDATGEAPQPAANRLTGAVSNVSSLEVDVDGACLAPGTAYQITTDGPAAIHFSDGRNLTFLLPGAHSGTL